MKLCTFEVACATGPVQRVGVVTEAGIVDATAARIALLEQTLPLSAAVRVGNAQVPPDMIGLIGSGATGLDWVREAVEQVLRRGQAANGAGQQLLYAQPSVKLLAPVQRPPNIANFSVWPEHSATAAAKGFSVVANTAEARVKPYWKGNPDSIVGPDAVLQFPPYATELDVECELVAVVGTGGKDLGVEAAHQAIVGYTIMNDVSAREIQMIEKKGGRGPSKGKDFDGGNVLGPWIVTSDEVGDVRKLHVSLHVNGRELSGRDTGSMLWDFGEMLSYVSLGQTVHPGQIISGGCYPKGSAMDLDCKLSPGDRVELRISKIGSLFCQLGQKPEKLAYPL